jgi:hypothetical protein
MDLATVGLVIKTATSAVGFIDKIADQIERFLTKKPAPSVPTAHRARIEQDGDAIVSRRDGKVVRKIRATDLQNLAPHDYQHIKVLEQSMNNHYAVWSAVYPKLALEVDPIAKARLEQQLKDIVRAMKSDLDGILKFLEQIGIDLDDHYMHIRHLVAAA